MAEDGVLSYDESLEDSQNSIDKMMQEGLDQLRIDESSLDVEWLEQPRLFLQEADKLAKLAIEVDTLKEELDLIKANLDFSIRANPEDWNLPKVTEASVSAAIIADEDYIAANKKYMVAKSRYSAQQNLVRALDQRKTALENLVRLHGQSYFSTPQADAQDLPSRVEAHRQRRDAAASERVGTSLKRRKQ